MISMKFALLPLALLAAPVAAQSLSDTHQMRWASPGKTTPLVSYHPHKRDCTQAAAPLHLSGKTPHMTAAPEAWQIQSGLDHLNLNLGNRNELKTLVKELEGHCVILTGTITDYSAADPTLNVESLKRAKE